MLQHWQAPGGSTEYAIGFGSDSARRILILPALFDESNKLRHFTIQTMRELARLGIGSILPDMPGCNESTASLSQQDLATWRDAASEAAWQLECSHLLTMRAGAIIAPDMAGWSYAPLAGKSALRAMLRARVLASKEAGQAEKSDALLALGETDGLNLIGYDLSAAMISQLAAAELNLPANLTQIAQSELGGPGLWLRAEPEHDEAQAASLAGIIADGMGI